MKTLISIAIDGFSACGKSTLAKDLASMLDYNYIDSGAMYRALTYFAIKNNLISANFFHKNLLINKMEELDIGFVLDENDKNCITLNNNNIEDKIRSIEVSNFVSKIAEIHEVREKMVKIQRELGENKAIVMDGRDIGSVVFPDAELKLFVTADIDVRTKRRLLELKNKNIVVNFEEVKKNLIERDFLDSHRKDSPLIQVEDAIVLDNSNLTKEEQLIIAHNLALNKINS
ncbi:MAG: (d)CMP kinase [Bacteroidales bacterium]|jgi:cytidylate kinase|nr:(d)CMP kinase [Bacteroidales bacterium]